MGGDGNAVRKGDPIAVGGVLSRAGAREGESAREPGIAAGLGLGDKTGTSAASAATVLVVDSNPSRASAAGERGTNGEEFKVGDEANDVAGDDGIETGRR